MTGTEYSSFDLGSVICFPVVVFLDDYNRNRFDLLISRKSLITLIADSASSYGIIIVSRTAVNNSCVFMASKWTLHKFSPVLYLLFLRKSGILMALASTLLSSGAEGLDIPDKELTLRCVGADGVGIAG